MFKFKFDALLKYRIQLEEACQQEFARAKEKWEEEYTKLEEYYERWKKLIHRWREIQKESISIRKIELYPIYMEKFKGEIGRQTERVRQTMQEMEEKRTKLLGMRKEKKMMESLREKSLQEYNFTMAKQERKFLDEIVTQRYRFKGKKQ